MRFRQNCRKLQFLLVSNTEPFSVEQLRSTPEEEGRAMHDLAGRLFPINRSITGNGVRETLGIIQETLPKLEIFEVPSGTEVFDWVVPPEWNAKDAWIKGPDGKKFAELSSNNLHLMSYSEPVHEMIDRDELESHLRSLPDGQ